MAGRAISLYQYQTDLIRTFSVTCSPREDPDRDQGQLATQELDQICLYPRKEKERASR